MFIFARHCEEEIVIDNHVRLKVNSISGNRVKVGIVAPPDMPIRHSQPQRQQRDPSALDCGPILVPENEPVIG